MKRTEDSMTLRPYPPASEGAPEPSRQPTRASIPARIRNCRWPRTVLLVEDEPFVREATRSLLESAGFEVLSTENAEAAIKAYETSPPIDLVMTDMILPGRTGRQLSADLRQRSPGLKVLITSGYSSAEYAADAPQRADLLSSQAVFEAWPHRQNRGDVHVAIATVASRPSPQGGLTELFHIVCHPVRIRACGAKLRKVEGAHSSELTNGHAGNSQCAPRLCS